MRRVLLVDDDVALLDGLRKALRTYRDWRVDVAAGGRAAIEALERAPAYDVVISDARMPDVDGEALMRARISRWPGALRVVRSGEVRAETAERLLGLSHQILAKPVRPATLHSRVEEALHSRVWLPSPGLTSLIGQLGDLPSLPRLYQELSSLLGDPRFELGAVVALLETDPAVCAKVLKLVNSAYFGFSRRVSSVREAVRLLGASQLRALVLTAQLFPDDEVSSRMLMEEVVARLGALRKLERLSGPWGWIELACTAATLCDIGRLVMAQRRLESFRSCEAAVEGGGDRLEVEARFFGADHTQLGAALLSLWGLPPELIDAIAAHHARPTTRGPGAALALVSLAQSAREGTRAAGPLGDAVAHAGALFGLDGPASLSLCGETP